MTLINFVVVRSEFIVIAYVLYLVFYYLNIFVDFHSCY